MYIILASTAVGPPAIHATRSNEKRPTSPQLIPPIIVRISASLFKIIIYMTAPLRLFKDYRYLSVKTIVCGLCVNYTSKKINLQSRELHRRIRLLRYLKPSFQFWKRRNVIFRDVLQPHAALRAYIPLSRILR